MNKQRIIQISICVGCVLTLLILPACSSGLGKKSLCQSVPEGLPSSLDLAEPGPFFAGKITYKFTDPARKDRPVNITVWYPAKLEKGAEPDHSSVIVKREPDFSLAPYPLILSSTIMARTFAPHLVSHGFVVASINDINTYTVMNKEMYQQPLDTLFALNKVTNEPPENLAGMINADMAGAMGYSFDGFNALTLSGVRWDPDWYLAQCADAENPADWGYLSSFSCVPARDWEGFASSLSPELRESQDGLWQPITDPRVKAVIPMAVEGYWAFGKEGLSFADRPTLMLDGDRDSLYPENQMIFKDLGSSDKTFITFRGMEHMMVYEAEQISQMSHFSVAFLGYHLQGCQDYAVYYSEDFMAQFEDFSWGVGN